jgi:hypothetical protein
MNALYDKVGDDTLATVEVDELDEQLGWNGRDSDAVVEFLRKQELAETYMGNQVSITNARVVEVERSRSHPDEPTEHFPRSSGVYIGGNASQVQISIGSSHIVQDIEFRESSRELMVEFLTEFRRTLQDLPIDDCVSVEATIDAAEVLLAAPQPNSRVLGSILGALREVALGVAGNAAFSGLVELARRLT